MRPASSCGRLDQASKPWLWPQTGPKVDYCLRDLFRTAPRPAPQARPSTPHAARIRTSAPTRSGHRSDGLTSIPGVPRTVDRRHRPAWPLRVCRAGRPRPSVPRVQPPQRPLRDLCRTSLGPDPGPAHRSVATLTSSPEHLLLSRPRASLACVVAFVALATAVILFAGDRLQVAGYTTPGAPSTRAGQQLERRLGYDPEPGLMILARTPRVQDRSHMPEPIARLLARGRAAGIVSSLSFGANPGLLDSSLPRRSAVWGRIGCAAAGDLQGPVTSEQGSDGMSDGKVLVTGGSGFVGGHCIMQLLDRRARGADDRPHAGARGEVRSVLDAPARAPGEAHLRPGRSDIG